MNRSQVACWFSLKILVGHGWAYLWTLTTPDEVDMKELSQRWRRFIWNGFRPCVRVFERHPGGHGSHVHFVVAARLEVTDLRARIARAGFGRDHAKRIPGKRARYIAKYLTKRAQSVPGVRRWACVGFKGCAVKDVVATDTHADELKMIMQKSPAPNGYNFYARWKLAEQRHRNLWWDACKHGDEPAYMPPFKALFRHWKQSPLTSIGKRIDYETTKS